MGLVRVAAGALVVVAVLAGCSSKQQASDTLPPASSPSSASATSAVADATLPPLGPPDFAVPVGAREQTPAGVEAFVRYYVELINRTSQAMDPQYLRQFSDGCEACSRIADDTERDAVAGYFYRGGAITIRSVAPATVQAPVGEIAFLADQAPLSVVDSNGIPVEGLQFGAIPNLSSGARARWDAGQSSWVLTQLTLG